MKTSLKVLACVIVLAVAALAGNALGFFKIPALDGVQEYGASVVAWAKNGFKGSPTASVAADTTAQPEAVDPSQAKAELQRLISESKGRAVGKYPDLAVVNTEMNSRFVFRYNWLMKENSPRLQEANWPETLAEECAVASKVRVKPGGGGKKLVASSTP